MTATRNWTPTPEGGLVLEMSVTVNGERFFVRSTTSGYDHRHGLSAPFGYIERDMRRKLMHSVETKLLGTAP